jgi:hypothetical protein
LGKQPNEGDAILAFDEIAGLIASPHAELLCRGNYVNRRGVRGYYIQVKCADHWCKVSISHVDRNYSRLTIDELDALDGSRLESAVTSIPIPAIVSAFEVASRTNGTLNKYSNASGIEGLWAEFLHDGSWYMVSVSHVDVPARPAPRI